LHRTGDSRWASHHLTLVDANGRRLEPKERGPARTRFFLSSLLLPGTLELRIEGKDFALVSREVSLHPGQEESLRLEIERGVEQVFELVLADRTPEETGRAQPGRIDFQIRDSNGVMAFDDREHCELLGDGRARFVIWLFPGSYHGRFEDHGKQGDWDGRLAEQDFEVLAAPQPVRVTIR
jgi:hypothetical protein